MQMEVYADIVFLINLVMDYFIFWITAKLCKKKVSWLRMFFGALVSALVYCVMMFIPPLFALMNILSAVIILMLGLYITFLPKSIKEMLKYIIIAHISAFAVGGAGIALFYMTNIGSTIGNFISFTVRNFSVKVLISSVCFSYILIKLFIHIGRKLAIKKQQFYSIRIFFQESFASIEALVDTGNTLYDPISNEPVIIAEYESIKSILPDSVRLLFYEQKEDDLERVLSSVLNTPFAGRIRMIPFSSLGKKNGMLIGFKPDRVELTTDGDNVIISDVVIGIYNLKLTKENTYQALLNPALCK